MPTLAEIDQQIAYLERQKVKIAQDARKKALAKVNSALAELNDLGFSYKLSEGYAVGQRSGARRTGIRNDVLATINASSSGMSPTDIRDALNITDNAGKQSVANALSALKKSGAVSVTNGKYTVA